MTIKAQLPRHIDSVNYSVPHPFQIKTSSLFLFKCEYTARRDSTLDKHVLIKHEGVRYSCDYCTDKSTYKVAFKQHIKAQRKGKRYLCKDIKQQ